MSWLNSFSAAKTGFASTLSNISGQLTDLTKDVLQEGTESVDNELLAPNDSKEVDDMSDQQRLVNHLRMEASRLRTEVKRLEEENRRLDDSRQEERSERERFEQQARRTQLNAEEAERIFNELRSTLESEREQARDEAERNVDRVGALEAELVTLRSSSSVSVSDDVNASEIQELRRRLAEAERSVQQAKDDHQSELVALQDVYSKKITSLEERLWSRGPSEEFIPINPPSSSFSFVNGSRTLITPPQMEESLRLEPLEELHPNSSSVYSSVDLRPDSSIYSSVSLVAAEEISSPQPSSSVESFDKDKTPLASSISPSTASPVDQNAEILSAQSDDTLVSQLRDRVAQLERQLRLQQPSSDANERSNGGGFVTLSSSTFDGDERSASTMTLVKTSPEDGRKSVELIGGFEDDNLFGVAAKPQSTDEDSAETSDGGEKDLVEVWEAQVEKLLEANKQLEAERNLLEDQLEDRRERIEALKRVVEEKTTEMEELTRGNRKMDEEFERKREEIEILKEEKAQLKDDLALVKEEVGVLEFEREDWSREREEWTKERETVTSKERSANMEMEQLKMELSELKSRCVEHQRISKENDEKEKYLMEIIRAMRDNLDEDEKSNIREQNIIENTKELMDVIREVKQRWTNKEKMFQETLTGLKENLSLKSHELETEIEKRLELESTAKIAESDSKVHLAEQQKTIEDIESNRRDLEERLESEKEKLEKMEMECRKLMEDIRVELIPQNDGEEKMNDRDETSSFEYEMLKLKNQIAERLKEIRNKEQNELNRREELENLLLKTEEELEKERRKRKDLESLATETSDHEAALRRLRAREEELDRRAESDAEAIADLEADKTRADVRVAEMKGELEKSGKELEESRKLARSLEGELAAERSERADVEAQSKTRLATALEEMDDLRAKLAASKEEDASALRDAREVSDQHQRELAAANEENKKIVEQLRTTNSRLRETEVQLVAEVERSDDLEAKISSFRTEAHEMLREKGELSLEIETLQLRLETSQLESQRSEEAERLATMVEVLKEEKKQLEEEMDDMERRHSKEKREYEKTISDLGKVGEEEGDALKRRLELLVKDIHEKDKELAKSAERIESLRNDAQESRRMMETLVEGQSKIDEIIREKEDTLDEVKREKEDLKEDYEDVLTEAGRLRGMTERLEEQLRSEQQQVLATRRDLDRSEAETVKVTEACDRLRLEVEALRQASSQSPDEAGSATQRSEPAGHANGMTDAEKMETKTLDLITEMEKKIMEHDREKKEWEEKLREAEERSRKLEKEMGDVEMGGEEEENKEIREQSPRSEDSVAIEIEDEATPTNDWQRKEMDRLLKLLAAEREANAHLQMQTLNETSSGEGDEVAMAKVACHKLSAIVRDKDVLIGALNQKIDSLVTLVDGQKDNLSFKTLLDEKLLLARQIASHQTEREQLTSALTQKHLECVNYYSELSKLMTVYQKEVGAKEDVAARLEECRLRAAEQERDLERERDKARALKDRLEREGKLREEFAEKAARDEAVTEVESENEEKRERETRLRNDLRRLAAELLETKDEAASYAVTTRRLEEANDALQREVETLNLVVTSKGTSKGDGVDVPSEGNSEDSHNSTSDSVVELSRLLESQKRATEQVIKEKESLMTKLSEAKSSERELLRKVVQLNSDAEKLNRDNDRFKEELLRLHSVHEHDSVAWQQREADLEERLEAALERANRSGNALVNLETRSMGKEKALSEEVLALAKDRDDARAEVVAMTTNVQQYARAVANLQMVLEQFQREKEAAVAAKAAESRSRLEEKESELDASRRELAAARRKTTELEAAVKAAARLGDQIDRKERLVAELRATLEERDRQLRTTVHALGESKASMDAKVDKMLMKSLFLGFLRSPRVRQREVLPPLAAVLEFSPEETELAARVVDGPGLMGGLASKFGGIVGAATATSQPTPPTMDGSFSEMFVKFLQDESVRTPVVPLPAEAMAADQMRAASRSSSSSFPAAAPPRRSSEAPVVPLAVPNLTFAASSSAPSLVPSSSISTPALTTASLISPMDPLLPLFSSVDRDTVTNN